MATRSNPRRFVVKRATRAKASGPYVCVDTRSNRVKAQGTKAAAAGYCSGLAPKTAKPKYRARKRVRSNPTPLANPSARKRRARKGSSRSRKMPADVLAMFKSLKSGGSKKRRGGAAKRRTRSNPSAKKRKSGTRKRRTPAQRAATKRMIAANKRRGGKKKGGARKSSARKRSSAKKRSNPSRRKSARKSPRKSARKGGAKKRARKSSRRR